MILVKCCCFLAITLQEVYTCIPCSIYLFILYLITVLIYDKSSEIYIYVRIVTVKIFVTVPILSRAQISFFFFSFFFNIIICLQVVVRLTSGLVETYKICNPQFKYRGELNPKRYLTTPSAGVLNDGFDNVNSDLILAVNDDLSSSDSRQRFAILLVIFNFHFSDTLPSFVVLLEA